jgi:hypothetical protein
MGSTSKTTRPSSVPSSCWKRSWDSRLSILWPFRWVAPL